MDVKPLLLLHRPPGVPFDSSIQLNVILIHQTSDNEKQQTFNEWWKERPELKQLLTYLSNPKEAFFRVGDEISAERLIFMFSSHSLSELDEIVKKRSGEVLTSRSIVKLDRYEGNDNDIAPNLMSHPKVDFLG